jgi:hypothetical protein
LIPHRPTKGKMLFTDEQLEKFLTGK